jgi:hypothetical protein
MSLYSFSCALLCVRTGSSTRWFFVEVLSYFASNAVFSFWQLDAFLFLRLFFAVNALCAIFLSVLHIKRKRIYIYIFAFASLTIFLFIDAAHLRDANTPKHWIRRREKKREKEEYTWSEFFSFWLWKKEENTMTIMKIYFVRFYIAWDREKEREKYSDRKHMRRWIVVTSNTKTCTYIKVCL